MANKEELEQIESSQRQHYETLQHHEKMNLVVEQADYNLFALLKPQIVQDGDQWCVLLGENLQTGIAGFGETPFAAIVEFNRAFHKQAKAVPAKAEQASPKPCPSFDSVGSSCILKGDFHCGDKPCLINGL